MKSIVSPNVHGLIVNPEDAAQAGDVGESGPVLGEDYHGDVDLDDDHDDHDDAPVPSENGWRDAVLGGLLRLPQPPPRPLLPRHHL